ncbi:MAG: hypothetical protein KGO52_03680 [Nitrospirota bacterium]|nr:hypothetical protein [Nitrospirota bacterium]MDE3118461.1 hypothetical protein [Nitrospirota bacterium]MDE3226181.1 hypothetical protein [Nitrospirota bacterium]MDE3241806.1 hypothetical protein [Nitrospirota bacterium]
MLTSFGLTALILGLAAATVSTVLAAPQAPADARSAQLPQLLLSSAWCSFSYNKNSGASHSTRVQFSPNGNWRAGSRGETYSSGPNGSVAGQHDDGTGGRWIVRQGQLFMSNPPDTPDLAPVGLTITHNSNGPPIITADGKEYSPCQ